MTNYEDSSWSDGLNCIVSCPASTVHFLSINIQLVEISQSIISYADLPPPVERRHLPVPRAELCPSLTNSESAPSEMIFGVEFIRFRIVISISSDVHPWAGVEQLEPRQIIVYLGERRF